MQLKTHIDWYKSVVSRQAARRGAWRARFYGLLYWLAGARQATLDQLPESERERIAILGSSVLIPTILAFFGMYLYADSQMSTSRPLLALLLAAVWAFLIMNVDRILMATYRPFQPTRRKVVQVVFRVGLAAFISVAIAFPFCLEQYRGAIHDRLQGEYQGRLRELQTRERADRELIETRAKATIADLQERLRREQAAGPVEPNLYAAILAKEALRQRGDTSRDLRQQLEQEAQAAQEEWQRLSARIREVDQDRKAESRGQLTSERGGTGMSGQGAKFKELSRELELLTKAEQTVRQRYNQLLSRAAAVQPADPPAHPLEALDAGQQGALLAEAKERKARIDGLEATLRRAETERTEQMRGHGQQYGPALQRYSAKIEGRFDPMEETIGLFKVMFVPEAGSDATDQIVQQYKWMAALFQFSIVFGTLFLLDLIAILTKVMSRPGPYDVLVDFPELVAGRNLELAARDYGRVTGDPAEAGTPPPTTCTVDLRDSAAVARILLAAHLPQPGPTALPSEPGDAGRPRDNGPRGEHNQDAGRGMAV